MVLVRVKMHVVVTKDPGAGSARLHRAAHEGVPLVDEPTCLRQLEDARPGQAKGTARRVSVPAPSLPAQGSGAGRHA